MAREDLMPTAHQIQSLLDTPLQASEPRGSSIRRSKTGHIRPSLSVDGPVKGYTFNKIS
jgi:hypothetical protein